MTISAAPRFGAIPPAQFRALMAQNVLDVRIAPDARGHEVATVICSSFEHGDEPVFVHTPRKGSASEERLTRLQARLTPRTLTEKLLGWVLPAHTRAVQALRQLINPEDRLVTLDPEQSEAPRLSDRIRYEITIVSSDSPATGKKQLA